MPVILALVLLLLAGPAGALTVYPDSMIFVGRPSNLTAVQARASGQNALLKADLKLYAASYGAGTDYNRALLCAQYELFTGDTQYNIRTRATRNPDGWLQAMYTASNGSSSSCQGAGGPCGTGEGSGFGRSSHYAILFNWFKSSLDPTARRNIALQLAEARRPDWRPTDAHGIQLCADTHCEPWRVTFTRLSFELAAYGETGDATIDAELLADIELQRDIFNAIIPCLNRIAENGEWGQYSFVRMANFLATYEMLKTMTDYAGAADDALVLSNGWRSLMNRMRPEMMLSPKARYYPSLDAHMDKWNVDGFDVITLASYFGCASPHPNAYARNLAKYCRDNRIGYGPQTEAVGWPLLWLDTTDPGTDWTTAPKSTFNSAMGWYFGRQAWELRTDKASTAVRFNAFFTTNAFNNHAAAGHYSVMRGSANGIKQSGWRDFDWGLIYYNWYTQAWAYDTYVIHSSTDANETRGSAELGCTAFGQTGQCDTKSAAVTWYNYGAQSEGDEVAGGQDLPECDYTPPGESRARPWKRGTQKRELDTPEFYYASVTNDLGQPAAKQAGSARALLWCKLPQYLGQGFGLSWDRNQLKPGVDRHSAFHHTINAPHLDGDITFGIVGGGGYVNPDSIPCDWDGPLGNPSLDLHGGVYRSTNTTAIWYDDLTSRFATFVLYAHDAAGNTPRVQVIGGPNMIGEHGKQSTAPCYNGSYRTLATGGHSYEWFHDGRNWPNGSYDLVAGNNCANAGWTCANGQQITRCLDSDNYSTDQTNANSRPYPDGEGADACFWSFDVGFGPVTYTTQTQADVICGWWTGPNTVAPDDIPRPLSTVTADQVAFAYKPVGSDTMSVIVVPQPERSTTFSGCTYTNPVFGSTETGSQTHTILAMAESRNWAIVADGVSLGTAMSDTSGTLAYSIPATAEEITIRAGNIVYPPPTPPPGPVPYTLANTVLYHPRERTLLQAGGGTLLLLYYGEGAYGAPIWAQLSRDDGQTWRDLDGAIDSATELVVDDEVAGPNHYTPRGDYGFSAAIDPTSNDLWVVTPAVRMNGSHTEFASLVRAKLYAWTGTTWSTSSSYTYNGSEVALASKPRDCVALVSAAHQLFAAWTGPSGANWSIQSVRIKSGTATALSAGAALASSSQSAQLLEYPRGTVWLLASVRSAATDDSIRVRTATDGGSAQWGATSRIAFAPQGTLGHWGACVGPSGPWLAARDAGLARYRYAYWTGSGWTTGLAPIEPTAGTEPSVTAAGATRVVLTSRYSTSVLRAYWSLSDGWSAWEDVATLTGLSYSHVVSLRPTDLLAVSARTGGFTATPFSLPAESEPTGACCAGACSVLTYAECVDLGGAWQGPDVPCSPDPCISPPEVGACCYPDGSCVVTAETGCGGVYQGDRTECSPNPCPSGPPSLAGRRRKVILAARGE